MPSLRQHLLSDKHRLSAAHFEPMDRPDGSRPTEAEWETALHLTYHHCPYPPAIDHPLDEADAIA